MASFENVTPFYIARLFEDQVAKEVRKELQIKADEIVKEILDNAINKVRHDLEVHADTWRSPIAFKEQIVITLNDKRKKDA